MCGTIFVINVFSRLATFDKMPAVITQLLIHCYHSKGAINHSGGPISAKTKLAMMLRWFAGASYIALCLPFAVVKSSSHFGRG
jgi:hypothetical protein